MNKNNSRKLPQSELRRSAVGHKSRISQPVASTKIESPLAKYDKKGNLSCIICRVIVNSISHKWKVHINSKQHKANIEAAKVLKADLLNRKNPGEEELNLSKRKQVSDLVRVDNDNQKEENDKNASSRTAILVQVTTDGIPKKKETEKQEKLGSLPENFFDVQIRQRDAKPVEDEWEKFQKEIKEQSLASTAIIVGDHETATIDRQIQEIDEQIFLWSKVVSLEGKKSCLNRQFPRKQKVVTEDYDSSDSSETFEEYPDWRCKNLSNKVQD